MKNIYLYGASDDCMECETDFGINAESYEGIKINNVNVKYVFDDDWGIWLVGDVPKTWVVRAIEANCATAARNRKYGGQFIHIQVPDEEVIKIEELESSE